MHSFRMLAVGVAAMLALSACDTLTALKGDVAGAGASIADAFVPDKVHAPIANTAAAAENFYTAATTVLTAAVNGRVVTLAQATRLGELEQKVYTALVSVRSNVEAGKDVTAALALFNAAYGNLYGEAAADGVALPTSVPQIGGGA